MTEMSIGYEVSDQNLTVILKVNRPFTYEPNAKRVIAPVFDSDEIHVRGTLNDMFKQKRFPLIETFEQKGYPLHDYTRYKMPKTDEARKLWGELAEDRLYQHPWQILVYEGKPEQLPDLKAFGKSRKIPIEDGIDARVAYLIENFASDKDLQKV